MKDIFKKLTTLFENHGIPFLISFSFLLGAVPTWLLRNPYQKALTAFYFFIEKTYFPPEIQRVISPEFPDEVDMKTVSHMPHFIETAYLFLRSDTLAHLLLSLFVAGVALLFISLFCHYYDITFTRRHFYFFLGGFLLGNIFFSAWYVIMRIGSIQMH